MRSLLLWTCWGKLHFSCLLHGQAKSASALTSILPMLLLAVSSSLDWWSFLSIARAAGGHGGAGAVVPCGCLGREVKQQVVFLAQGMMPREEQRKV